MAYMNPRLVVSPKGAIANLTVLFDGGEEQAEGGNPWSGWSVAEFDWYGNPCLGIRWNGGDAIGNSHIGNPQSRGVATWFVVPEPLADSVRAQLAQLKFRVVFHPTSIGVGPGQRGPLAEISTWHPTLKAAQDSKGIPPISGYIAVKIEDRAGRIFWPQAASHE